MRLTGAAVALVAALGATSASAAELPRHAYAQALAAVEAGQWQLAATRLSFALRVDPVPHARVRLYGMHYVDYVPAHLAGLVAAELGDCPAALAGVNDPATARLVAESVAESAQRAHVLDRCRNH